MMEPTISQDLLKWIEYFAYLVAAASAVCKAAEWILHSLPKTPRHDKLDMVEKILIILQQILRIPALNPKVNPVPCDDTPQPDIKPKPTPPPVIPPEGGNVNDY